MNTYDPDIAEERWQHERSVRAVGGRKANHCTDCGDVLPDGVSWHQDCWLRDRMIENAANVHRG